MASRKTPAKPAATSRRKPAASSQRTAKKQPAKRSAKQPAKPPRRWLRLVFKLGLVGLVLLVAWGVYLDAKIVQRFESGRWHLPAQVYARSLPLQSGLARQDVLDELELLSYRRVSRLRKPGEYAVSKHKIEVYRREFFSPWGKQFERRLLLTFDNGQQLITVEDSRSGRPASGQSLEPMQLGRLTHGLEQERTFLPLDETPPLLVDTLLLVEDRQFYRHLGVSPLGILRALWVNMQAGRTVQGGSTLTQQLIKNLFLEHHKTLVRKINEAYMSLVIELRYSKQEILESYLNEVALGQSGARGIHGFSLAAEHLFARPLAELEPHQVALLVGMIKGPSWYDPRRNPERALERRDLVLRLMMQAELISGEQYRTAVNQGLSLRQRPPRSRPFPAYLQLVQRELSAEFSDLPQGSGYQVFTALDPQAQRAAELAVSGQLEQLIKQGKGDALQGAMAVVDRTSGGLRALVGDRQVNYPGFNRALDARRPIGSLIKPVVTLAALEQPERYNLLSPLEDRPITLGSAQGQRWQPRNYDRQFVGQLPLIDALAGSRNVPAVNLGMALGLPEVIDTLHQLGIDQPIEPYPSLLLGSLALSPLEVAGLYQAIANGGRPLAPHAVIAVLDQDGQLLRGRRMQTRQVVSEQASYLTQVALQAVTEHGTAKRLSATFTPGMLAGKTGTSNELRDSWFAGFDGRDVVSAWVGFDNNRSAGLTGSSGALPLFEAYFARRRPLPLPGRMPEGVELAYLSHNTGLPVSRRCNDARQVPVVVDALGPSSRCSATSTPATAGGDTPRGGEKQTEGGIGGWLRGLFN